MEFVGAKKRRRKDRKRNCSNNLKRRRDRGKFEVKSEKRQKISKGHNTHVKKDKININTMEANAFWQNYEAAHEWQKKHLVTWWKTRCFALQHENYILKETIRNLVNNQNNTANTSETNYNDEVHSYNEEDNSNEEAADDGDNEEEEATGEDFEFELNEGMMNFLAQSIRHKMELKSKRESEAAEESSSNETEIKGGLAWINKRNEDAKLLYGGASSTVLAMETALQATIDRHIDKAKPQYWPNIPLKF